MKKFKDRNDAAQQLIPYLNKYKNERGTVLAVPRGGVPIAYPVAKAFNMPLELLMTKKIGHPHHEEFAIGAVSLEDHIVDEEFAMLHGYIDTEVNRIRESLRSKYTLFMGDRKPMELRNKLVIIIDDGIATGNTILSSIRMLRKRNPHKIVVAVPVASPEAAEKIKQVVDDFICLSTPVPFYGVGYHYEDFTQVTDQEVIQMLKDVNHFEDAA